MSHVLLTETHQTQLPALTASGQPVHLLFAQIRSELRRLSKTPSVPLLWLAFPLGLSLIEYGAFGHLGGGTGLPKGTLLLVDRDGSALSGIL